MGFNFKEEYWDDSSHLEISSLRLSVQAKGENGPSLGPWQDVGAKVRGSILYDMAQNMRQGWEQKNEVLPAAFVGNGVSALLSSAEAKAAGWNSHSFEIIKATLDKAKPLPVSYWENNFQLWCLGICAFLTGVIEVIDATLSGKFNVDRLVKVEEAWGGNPASAEKLTIPPEKEKGWYRQCAQYLRTFSLKQPPLDLSIATAMHHNLDSVNAEGLLYFENQYFRDPLLGQELVKLHKTRSNGTPPPKPYIIVVTNRQTNDREQPVNAEATFAAAPTHMVYKHLMSGIGESRVLYCWMHVQKPNERDPKGPRTSHPGESLVTAIVAQYKKGGEAELMRVRARIMKWRNRIYRYVQNEFVQAAGRGGATVVGAMNSMTQWISAIGVPINIWISGLFYDARNYTLTKLLEVADPASEYVLTTGPSTSLWDVFDDFLGKLPEPPEDGTASVTVSNAENAEISAKVSQWFERENTRMQGINDANDRYTKIRSLEDQSRILDALAQHAGTDLKKILYINGAKALNNIALWKENRFKRLEEEKEKAIKGAVYIHSKVMIIDDAVAMIGSNNINERSMYHDSENAILFRATARESMPSALKSSLFDIMVGQGLDDNTGEETFSKFRRIASANAKKIKTGGLTGHVVTYEPHFVGYGSVVLS